MARMSLSALVARHGWRGVAATVAFACLVTVGPAMSKGSEGGMAEVVALVDAGDFRQAESAIAQAVSDSEAAGIHGPAATPYVLARVAQLTDGRSVAANLALIENNARVAGGIAVELSRT
jgi:hypothetical protein